MPKDTSICDPNVQGGGGCRNGGQCTETAHSIVCRCPVQWSGPYCEVGYRK